MAWTTTPWTLPSNVSLCVNADLDYVVVCDVKTKVEYIVYEGAVSSLYKNSKDYKIVEKFKGSALKGKRYEPLFNYFLSREEAPNFFQVLNDDYVTTVQGTGVVHQAPYFGEVSFSLK